MSLAGDPFLKDIAPVQGYWSVNEVLMTISCRCLLVAKTILNVVLETDREEKQTTKRGCTISRPPPRGGVA